MSLNYEVITDNKTKTSVQTAHVIPDLWKKQWEFWSSLSMYSVRLSSEPMPVWPLCDQTTWTETLEAVVAFSLVHHDSLTGFPSISRSVIASSISPSGALPLPVRCQSSFRSPARVKGWKKTAGSFHFLNLEPSFSLLQDHPLSSYNFLNSTFFPIWRSWLKTTRGTRSTSPSLFYYDIK